MRIFVNVDSGKIVQGLGNSLSVDKTNLLFKRGDKGSGVEVQFVSGNAIVELDNEFIGQIALKEVDQFDADPLTISSNWVKTGAGASTVYTFDLNLNTTEINTALGHDGTTGNDLASIDVMIEVEWRRTSPDIIKSTNAQLAILQNDVIKGNEGTPTSALDTYPSASAVVQAIADIANMQANAIDIMSYATVTGEATDFVLIADSSDSNNLKKVSLSELLGGGSGGGSVTVVDDETAMNAITPDTTQLIFRIDTNKFYEAGEPPTTVEDLVWYGAPESNSGDVFRFFDGGSTLIAVTAEFTYSTYTSTCIVEKFNLTTPFDISTKGSAIQSVDLNPLSGADIFFDDPLISMSMTNDGTKLYISDFEGIQQYDFGTAFDLTTLSFVSRFESGNSTDSYGDYGTLFKVNGTGTHMLEVSLLDQVLAIHSIAGGNVASASVVSSVNIFTVVTQNSYEDLYLDFENDNGTSLLFFGNVAESVGRIVMTTPYDLSTATEITDVNTNLTQSNLPTGNYFDSDIAYDSVTNTLVFSGDNDYGRAAFAKAPSSGLAWLQVPDTVGAAPVDGQGYARKDGSWVALGNILGDVAFKNEDELLANTSTQPFTPLFSATEKTNVPTLEEGGEEIDFNAFGNQNARYDEECPEGASFTVLEITEYGHSRNIYAGLVNENVTGNGGSDLGLSNCWHLNLRTGEFAADGVDSGFSNVALNSDGTAFTALVTGDKVVIYFDTITKRLWFGKINPLDSTEVLWFRRPNGAVANPEANENPFFTVDGNTFRYGVAVGINDGNHVRFRTNASIVGGLEINGAVSYKNTLDRLGQLAFKNEGDNVDLGEVESTKVKANCIELKGSVINGEQITIPDNSFATIIPEGRYGGFLTLVANSQSATPQMQFAGYGLIDFGDSPVSSLFNNGANLSVVTSGTPTGTTGIDGNVSVFLGGTSGEFYIENRSGISITFQSTLL